MAGERRGAVWELYSVGTCRMRPWNCDNCDASTTKTFDTLLNCAIWWPIHIHQPHHPDDFEHSHIVLRFNCMHSIIVPVYCDQTCRWRHKASRSVSISEGRLPNVTSSDFGSQNVVSEKKRSRIIKTWATKGLLTFYVSSLRYCFFLFIIFILCCVIIIINLNCFRSRRLGSWRLFDRVCGWLNRRCWTLRMCWWTGQTLITW